MSVGTLVKSIAMQIIADPGDSHAVLDELNLKGDQLRRPITMVLTADGAQAQAGVDAVTQAFIAYSDAALKADEAAARFAQVQATNAKDSDIYRLALDENTKATLAAADAQIRLAEAEAKAGAGAKIAGDDEIIAGGKADTAGGMFAAAGEKMKLGAGMMLGLGVAIAGVGYESVKMAISFQRSMELLVTQAGVGKAQLASLKTGVLQLAGQVGFSPDSLSASLFHVASNMASVGSTSTQMMGVLRIAAEGAQVGNANLVDVTNALTAAIVSGIPGVQNYGQAMGTLNAIVGSGDMTMQDLAEAFGSGMIATVKGYGLTLTDVGAGLATFGDNNVRGAHAATMLRMAVQYMANPLSTAAPLLAKLGMSSTQLATDMQNGGLLPALKDLQSHFKAAGISGKEMGQYITGIFGKKAGSGLNILLDEMGRFESKYPALTAGAGKFASAWQDTKKTVSVELHQIGASFDSVLIIIGQKVLPVVEKVFGFIASHQRVAIGLAAAIGTIVGAMGLFTVATKLAGAAMTVLDIEMEANPIGLVVVAIAALVIGLYELYKHCSWVRTAVHDVAQAFIIGWHEAMHLAGAAITWFDNGPLKFIKAEIGQFTAFWKKNHVEIMAIVGPVWRFISTTIVTNMKIAWDVIKGIMDVLIGVWKANWDVIWGVIKIVWSAISTVIKIAVTNILGVIQIGLDIIHGHWSAAWQELQTVASTTMADIRSFLLTAVSDFGSLLWNAGKALIGGLISGISSSLGSLGSFLGGIGSFIASHKGPLDYDRVLLVPHGQAIIGGLIAGMDSMRPALQAHLRGVTAAISGPGGYGTGGYGGAAQLELTVRAESSDPLMAALLQSLRYEIRVKGGSSPNSVQAVLGRH